MIINKNLPARLIPVESGKLGGATAKPWTEMFETAPGHVWCTESLAKSLKDLGLAPGSATYTLPSGINLHAYKLPPEKIQHAMALLARGQTAFGPLKDLEKANQLSTPASEIQKQARAALQNYRKSAAKPSSLLTVGVKPAQPQLGAVTNKWLVASAARDSAKPKAPASTDRAVEKQARRTRVERLVKAGEGVSFLTEAVAKFEPGLATSAQVFGGVFAAADAINLVTSRGKKMGAQEAFCLTGDMLVVANAVLLFVPHAEKAKPTLEILGLLYKGVKSVHAAIYQNSPGVAAQKK